jgi:FdhD protein
MSGGISRVGALVVQQHQSASGGQSRIDDVVVEEPLEIRLGGDPFTTTMRTPGEDRFLAVGNLFCEGIITGLADVGTVAHCGRTDDPRYGNAIEVTPASGTHIDDARLERGRRLGLTTSACGICGRDGIDDLLARLRPLPADVNIAGELLARAPALLAEHQPTFARTGGLHAAAAIDSAGNVVAFAEDIGRHNAVDKVVGKLLYTGQLPAGPATSSGTAPVLLLVSGRASFEMVQKAATAGFVALASVSAASSLAIETAQAVGLTLAAFARAGRFTIYSGGQRVVLR